MTLRRSITIAPVAMGAKSASTSALAHFFLSRPFLGGLLSLDAMYGANKNGKLIGRMQMKSMYNCKREEGD